MTLRLAHPPRRPGQSARTLGLNLFAVALAFVSLGPLLWVVAGSFKTGEDLFGSTFLPWEHLGRLTLRNFAALFTQQGFGRWLVNSLFLAATHTVLVVTLSSLGGFALAKYRFPGKRPLMLLMLATMLLPAQILLPGSYELMAHLGWLNSYAAIVVPGMVSVFGIFLFRQAMTTVPDELLQAARVDGCGELRLWWEVALPVVRPMTGAYTLLSFMADWNSFLWPQVVLQDEGKYTLPIAMANLVGMPQYQSEFGIILAGTVVSLLPVMILFFALQREFIAGLASGAVKG